MVNLMKAIYKKIVNIINEYDSFILMGHKDPDLDVLGSCMGMCEIIESFKKDAYLFLDIQHLNEYNNNINRAFDMMERDIKCVDKTNYKKYLNNTLLIVLDTHIEDRLEFSDIVDEIDTMVIDHHIKSKHYIKNTKFMYIDSTLSSVSEFVALFANELGLDLDNVIASILLGGIEIDTNGYDFKTTKDTYLASSILMEMGADSILKQELLKETKEDYIKRASFIRNSFMLKEGIACCILPNCTTLELATVAEELLKFDSVEASFALGKIDIDTVGISAKSLGNINVETIMKKFNGGGHISNAAAQVKGKTIKQIKNEIKNML